MIQHSALHCVPFFRFALLWASDKCCKKTLSGARTFLNSAKASAKKEEDFLCLPLHAFFSASFFRSLKTFVGGNGILDLSTITAFLFLCFALIKILCGMQYCAPRFVKRQKIMQNTRECLQAKSLPICLRLAFLVETVL